MMSRFANISTKDESFQVYSRRPQRNSQNRYQDRFINSFKEIEKEKKIITEDNFPELSKVVVCFRSGPPKAISKDDINKLIKDCEENETNKIKPILNYREVINCKESVKVIPQVLKEEIVEKSEESFTQEEAQNVFEKMVSNWKIYEDVYINEYGEDEYLKKYGNFIYNENLDVDSEISDEEEIDE